MISTEEDLRAFCNGLREDIASANASDAFLTVDTEFIMDSATVPLLCSVQIASENRADIIDALEIKDKSTLSQLLEDSSILKVFHGSDQDIDILTQNGVYLENIYDTQLAELAISSDKIASYATLVLKYLKRHLKKTYKISDWEKRPLSAQQEKYALNDVSYLREVFKKQYAILAELKRVEWVEEEMAYRLSSYKNSSADNVLSAFSKHIYELEKESLAILKELAIWRMKIAQNKEIPEHSVLRNDLLLSVAKGGMVRIRQLQKSRFYKDETVREFVAIAIKICKAHKIIIKSTEKDNAPIADFLKIILDYCSQKFNINKGFIADSEDICAIANDVPHVCEKFQHGWRYTIFGKYIQPAKDGRILVLVDNGKLQIVEK